MIGSTVSRDQIQVLSRCAEYDAACCCPPNLSRTLGMIGGYTWTTRIDASAKTIHLDIYLYLSATRTIPLPRGGEARVSMKSDMPWQGKTELKFEAPEGWKWAVRVPKPDYAADVKVGPLT